MGCMTKLFRLLCVLIVTFVSVLFGPNPLPDSVNFTEFHVTPPKYFGDALAENQILDNAERLFEDEIKGPESFEVINGELYTTLHGGYVAKVYDDQVIPVIKFGEPCVGWYEESKCGRPLGLKAYGNDYLIVADSYFGIFMFNLKTNKFTNLVHNNTVIDGKRTKTFNGVEVASDGSIYWTHSSTDFTIQDGLYTLLADASGRMIKYDPVTQKNVVLMKDLHFANGIVLSPEEDFLLVSETGLSRIHKYYLKGPKKSQSEIFIDGLPGMPDNLRYNGHDGFFAPLVIYRDENTPALFQVISPFPLLRKFLARILSFVELSLNKIHEIYPHYFIQRAIHYVGHLESVGAVIPTKTVILEIGLNGNILRSYQGSDGSISFVSDVIVHNGYFYLGSPYNNYLGRVKLPKLGVNHLNHRPKPSAPTTTRPSPPPPTTTRPPPPPPTTISPPSTTSRPPPPPPTTTRSPSTTSRPPPPPPTTTRPPPPPPTTTRPPPTPPTTSRPPPPPPTTTRPPPTTTRPPPTTTRPPPTPPTTTRPPPSPTTSRPPPPPPTTSRPPPPSPTTTRP